MEHSAPAVGPGVAENPWRTVLEFQRGLGPDLKDRRRHRDPSLVLGLASGIGFGATVSVLFFAFVFWVSR